MPVTLSDAAAEIAAITIDAYLEEHRNTLRHFTTLSAVLGTPEPQPLADRTIIALGIVLEQLREHDPAVTQPPASATREAIAEHVLRDVLREVRSPRTLEELELRCPFPFIDLPSALHELEERQLVRVLEDGRGTVTWEITEAGELTL